MNRTAGGRDNPALDVDSLKAAELARIGDDNTAKKKAVVVPRKQNVLEMTTRIGRNEPAAKTEQAINPNKRSDSMMLQRLLYFMGGVAVISLLIATTALVLVLIVMSQNPHTTLTDPGTVHASGLSSPIDQGIQNLTKSLQTVQIGLENIWMVINSTAERTSNLESKLREETNTLKTLIESLMVQRRASPEQSLQSQENKTRDLSLRLELTQRELKSFKDRLTVQTVALWKSQNSTMAELNKLKTVWTAINTTAEKTSNLTDKIGDEIQTVWLKLNQSTKHSRTLTNYIQSFKENVTYRSLRLEARIEKEEQISNNTKTVTNNHFKKIQNLEILINVTRHEAEKANWQHTKALLSSGNFTSKEFLRVWTEVNASQAVLSKKLRKARNDFARKINNFSKMMGPIGPRGFNGSQGPRGPMGSIGPVGPKGTGDLSTCRYKTLKEKETPGDQLTLIILNEPHGKRVIGVTCSANYGAENNLSSRLHNNTQQYFCVCRKTDPLINPPQGVKRTCFLHYWRCPLTT